MAEKIKGIVIDLRHHNEKYDVVTIFTAEYGRIAMLTPLSTTKGGKIRRARLQPLAVIETELNYRPTRELHRLGAFSPIIIWQTIYFHPLKRLIVFFLSEFLNRVLRASMPDENTWHFILDALTRFDAMERGYNDFHPAFLINMLPFVGIMPDFKEYRKGYFFDMREGRFSSSPPLHNDYLKKDEARLAALTGSVTLSNLSKLKLNSSQRNRLVDHLLRYYDIHFPGTGNIKSLETLKEITS